MYCKVSCCKFSWTHVTRGHRCDTCKKYGHGVMECYNNFYKKKLLDFDNDVLPDDLHCKIQDCECKNLHTTDAHYCPKCNYRMQHKVSECINKKTYSVKCPLCKMINLFTFSKQMNGLTDFCSICFVNNANVLLPGCGHIPICSICLNKLD